MMKTSRTRLSIASLSAVASSRWMARRCEQSIWGLTTPRLRDHRQWLINRPEFPEFRRQNFRNPHADRKLGPALYDAIGIRKDLRNERPLDALRSDESQPDHQRASPRTSHDRTPHRENE